MKDWLMMSKHKFFASLSLAMLVVTSPVPANAAGQKPDTDLTRLQSPASAPNVQIGQVRNVGIQGDAQHQEAVVEIEAIDNAASGAHSSNLKFKVIDMITITQEAINRVGDIRRGLTVVGKKSGTVVVNRPQTAPREPKPDEVR
jgi:hypothetical protein